MSVADSRPLPLVRVVPWWPGALAAAVLTGLVAVFVREGWLDRWGPPDWLRDVLAPLGDWKLAAVVWLVLTLLFGALVDLFALRGWRREIEGFDLAAPGSERGWTYAAYAESLRTLPERHDLADVHDAIERRRAKLGRRLTQGWLFKYYLLCFALPLVGLLLGLFNLKALGGNLPLHELFRPLLAATLGPLAVLVLALLVARRAQQALETWAEKARQIAAGEQSRRAPAKLPQLAFRRAQLELRADDYHLATELVLSEPAGQDVVATFQVRNNNNPTKVEPPRDGKVVIPAGQTAVALELPLLVNPASFDVPPPDLELEIGNPQNARLGSPARQVVRWRLEAPGTYGKNGEGTTNRGEPEGGAFPPEPSPFDPDREYEE